jgi:hypothetical protein
MVGPLSSGALPIGCKWILLPLLTGQLGKIQVSASYTCTSRPHNPRYTDRNWTLELVENIHTVIGRRSSNGHGLSGNVDMYGVDNGDFSGTAPREEDFPSICPSIRSSKMRVGSQ